MLMITLTHPSGRGIRVNALAIAYIDADANHTLVAFSAGRQLLVTESADEIESLAAEAGKGKGRRA